MIVVPSIILCGFELFSLLQEIFLTMNVRVEHLTLDNECLLSRLQEARHDVELPVHLYLVSDVIKLGSQSCLIGEVQMSLGILKLLRISLLVR